MPSARPGDPALADLAERASRAKRPRWSALPRSRFEVWTACLSQLTTGNGFSIRYALVQPRDGPGRAVVGFASSIPDHRDATLAVAQTYPIDQHARGDEPLVVGIGPCRLEDGRMTGMLDAAGTPVTWDLVHDAVTDPLEPLPDVFYRTSWVGAKVVVPQPFLQVGGKIGIGSRAFILNGDPGVQLHVWGGRPAAEWTWFHASSFLQPGGEPLSAYVTGIIARQAWGALALPPLAFGHLVWREHHVALRPAARWAERWTGPWRWTGRRGDEEITVTVTFAWSDMVRFDCDTPAGGRLFCHQSSRADCRVELRAPRRPPSVFLASGSTHVEVGSRRADPRAGRGAVRQR